MNSTKRISDFLPAQTRNGTKLVQARVNIDLYLAVKEQMATDKKNGIATDMISLIEASFRAYLSERGVKKIP